MNVISTPSRPLAPKTLVPPAGKSSDHSPALPCAVDEFTPTLHSGPVPRSLKPADLAQAGQPARAETAVVSPALLQRLNDQGLSAVAQPVGLTGLGLVHLAEGSKVSKQQEKEILALFDDWNGALQTKDSQVVTNLYAEDAILLPTVSSRVRHNHEEIKDYFDHFLQLDPKGTINEHNVRRFGDVAINSGVYTFDLNTGQSVQARYTYVYEKSQDGWRIVEHHSSKMPEQS